MLFWEGIPRLNEVFVHKNRTLPFVIQILWLRGESFSCGHFDMENLPDPYCLQARRNFLSVVYHSVLWSHYHWLYIKFFEFYLYAPSFFLSILMIYVIDPYCTYLSNCLFDEPWRLWPWVSEQYGNDIWPKVYHYKLESDLFVTL